MLIYVQKKDYGAVEALPVSEEYRRKIRAHLREFLPKESAKAALYFQDGEEAVDALNLNRTHIRELRMGWTVKMRVDDWEFLRCYGWDTHLLVESGLLYQKSKRARKPALTRRKSDKENDHA